jgi:short-subunit dehydrogenase
MAGLVATPGQGSYTATKHAVVGLSKALRVEARHHGVRVSVLCPGVIRTPILSGGKFGRLNYVGIGEEQMRALWQRLRPMDVDVFAKKALAAIAGDQAIIVLPRWWKAFWYVDRLSPALSRRLWRIMLDRSRAELAQLGARPAARAAEGEVREDERREAWTERS